jgi:HSP20 family molecular chaperone IbpA
VESKEIMSNIAHRFGSPMGEVLDWLDQNAPIRMRGFGIVPYVRVEDFVQEGTYVLRAELPGIDPEQDIDLEVNADSLTVSGRRREEKRDRNHHEFHYGSFSRTVPLPRGVKPEDVKASYTDGVLEVRMPMPTETQQTQRIPISHETTAQIAQETPPEAGE